MSNGKTFHMLIALGLIASDALAGPTHAVLPLKGIPKKVALDNLVQVDEAYVGDLRKDRTYCH